MSGRVPQRVGMDVPQPCLLADYAIDTALCQSTAFAHPESRVRGVGMAPAAQEVALQIGPCFTREAQPPVAAVLALVHDEVTAFEVDIFEVECRRFAYPEAAIDEDAHNRSVAS